MGNSRYWHYISFSFLVSNIDSELLGDLVSLADETTHRESNPSSHHTQSTGMYIEVIKMLFWTLTVPCRPRRHFQPMQTHGLSKTNSIINITAVAMKEK